MITRLLLEHADKIRTGSMVDTVTISDKVRPHRLESKAFLYVRWSSTYQVLHNRESRALTSKTDS